MIKLENVVLPSPEQMEFIIEGMRNPMNSWEKSDTYVRVCRTGFHEYKLCDPGCCNPNCSGPYINKEIGPNDLDLMQRLANAGSVHRKYMRMMPVYVRITAPLYWWKEFDTYKVGTVSNSCSTMHKIHDKPFSSEDISTDMLIKGNLINSEGEIDEPLLKAHYKHQMNILASLNNLRDLYLKTRDKKYWRCMIEMLPSSYNQTRNVMMNYEVLANIYKWRKDHRLDEWREFCKWIEKLPYSELITGLSVKLDQVTEEKRFAEPFPWVKKGNED